MEFGEPYIDEYGYLRNSETKKLIHREVWEEANGDIPDEFVVHHINGDKYDNKLENLIALPIDVHEILHRTARYWKIQLPSRETIEQLCKSMNSLDIGERPDAFEWPELAEATERRRAHLERI